MEGHLLAWRWKGFPPKPLPHGVSISFLPVSFPPWCRHLPQLAYTLSSNFVRRQGLQDFIEQKQGNNGSIGRANVQPARLPDQLVAGLCQPTTITGMLDLTADCCSPYRPSGMLVACRLS
eukprot:scaffold148280_cov17-Tisochrysis_lutea.AAC.1